MATPFIFEIIKDILLFLIDSYKINQHLLWEDLVVNAFLSTPISTYSKI